MATCKRTVYIPNCITISMLCCAYKRTMDKRMSIYIVMAHIDNDFRQKYRLHYIVIHSDVYGTLYVDIFPGLQ